MAELAVGMLHRAMTTFAEEDARTARSIIQQDEAIDNCYARLYSKAIGNVVGNLRSVEQANYVIWTAHNLERLGDRVSHICEQVIYIVHGKHPELDSARQNPGLLWSE
jgi:phosphate transport system protein